MSERDHGAEVKSSGEAQFLDEMDAQLAGWADPRARLYQALKQNELVLYGQLILNLQDMQFAMAEVLVRLREEEAALLPPGEFLPVFELYHMLPDLDRWVVTNVVTQLARGSRIARLGINVSSQSLEDPGFAKFIADTLITASVPSTSLMFEIAESDVLFRLEHAARFAAAVRAIGCAVTIDGFGSRAVSFAPLKTLRTDFLKVDGSIVRNILRSPIALSKLVAVLRVGKTIGTDVIAEFVEDQDVLMRLKALGVPYAQGFGIHEPCPLAKLLGESIHAPSPDEARRG
ncbi:MAG TPA: EAL domain-containing protein [Burkholderiales bacterium]|nr:EAL domain-containing protein [Burkholderiales bacterium]